MYNAIIKMYNLNYKAIFEMGKNGKNYYSKKFFKKNTLKKLYSIIDTA